MKKIMVALVVSVLLFSFCTSSIFVSAEEKFDNKQIDLLKIKNLDSLFNVLSQNEEDIISTFWLYESFFLYFIKLKISFYLIPKTTI